MTVSLLLSLKKYLRLIEQKETHIKDSMQRKIRNRRIKQNEETITNYKEPVGIILLCVTLA